MELEPINPLTYITNRDPVPEKVLTVANWFKTETMELDFGEYVGRPSENITMHMSTLQALFAEGWFVVEVKGSASGGEWISTAKATATQKAESESESSASSTSVSNANSQSIKNSDTMSQGLSNGSATGTSTASGNATSSGGSTSVVESGGAPYWYAYQTLKLQRRRMQPDAILQDMVTSFTNAYNEGRQINDERYDELVNLYAIMLARTEDEANAFAGLSTEDFKPLWEAIKPKVEKALEDYAKSVDGLPDDWMQSRKDEINRKFDELVGQAKAKMVTEGTYNSTVWPTTLSGIERDRQYALNDLKDEMVTLKIEAHGKIATMTADIGNKLLDCEIRFIEAQQKMLLGPTEVRNNVFKWMLDFMERRDDEYPGLDAVANVAGSLGFANGGVIAPASAVQ